MIKSSYSRRAALAAAFITAGATSLAVAPIASATNGYAAIAYSGNGASGWAAGYDSPGAARQTAINYCGYTDCDVLASYGPGGCVAVAYDGGRFYGGTGPSLAAAENDAINNLGGGWIDSWACN